MSRQYILIVDDDPQVDLLTDLLVQGNFQVLYAKNVEEAINFAKTVPEIRFGLLDMRLSDYQPYTDMETEHGIQAGLRLHVDLEELLPEAKFLFKTVHSKNLNHLREVARTRKSVVQPFVFDGNVPLDVIESRATEASQNRPSQPWVLIVHGHDTNAVGALKGLLLARYGLTQVHVLRELPSAGLAVIENFERNARRADLVFALLTDDDRVAGNDLSRARQNVIFEIGYFCSALSRKSGRLIMMARNDIEFPSNMRGLWPIDITNGVDTPATREKLDADLGPLGIVPVATRKARRRSRPPGIVPVATNRTQ